MADFLGLLPLGKILPSAHYGLDGASGVRLKTIAMDACALVAGRDLPGLIARAREGFAAELADGPRVSHGDDVDFVGVGPGRWLVLSDERGLAPRLDAALAPVASVFDQSGGVVVLEAEGSAMTSLLAKLAPLDVHESAFPVGAAATTSAAHVNIALWRRDDAWRIAVGRSFLAAFLRVFSCAAAEFGLDWAG